MLNLFSLPSKQPKLSESTSESISESTLDSEIPPYRVAYKRVKYPRMSIRADKEGLVIMNVSVPPHFSLHEVEEFILRHKEWIIKTTHKLKSRHLSLENELISHKDEILLFGTWLHIANAPSKAQLKAQLHDYIAPRLEHFSTLMALPHQGFKITNAQSRFGSCTHDNRLFFSLMLGFAPMELIDYVIIHELAHIRHKDHSRAFWQLVERYCPNCKNKRQLLRHEARLYPEMLRRLG